MNRLNNFTNEEIIFLIQAISYINRHFVDTIEESRNLYLELLKEEKKEVYKGVMYMFLLLIIILIIGIFIMLND